MTDDKDTERAQRIARDVACRLTHLSPDLRAKLAQQQALAERKMKRTMLGGCECGEVAGEAVCPWCDRDDLPEHLRAAGTMLRQRDRARGKIDVAKAVEALAGVAKVEPIRDCKTRPANRFERRRDAARRRKR